MKEEDKDAAWFRPAPATVVIWRTASKEAITTGMNVVLIGCAAFVMTLLGGLFALRLKDRLHLILGFSAGAVVGVAFFDLLPEALELGAVHGAPVVTSVMAAGFLAYLILDRLVRMPRFGDAEAGVQRGRLGAGSLSIHSLLDGVGMGLAFKVSPAVGLVVAFAVLTHDFSDGINTVNLVLKNSGNRGNAFKWLVVDAVAPIIGVVATLFWAVAPAQLGLLLALFAGFFFYIGASDLVPESYHAHPVGWTTIMTVAGAVLMYAMIQLAHF